MIGINSEDDRDIRIVLVINSEVEVKWTWAIRRRWPANIHLVRRPIEYWHLQFNRRGYNLLGHILREDVGQHQRDIRRGGVPPILPLEAKPFSKVPTQFRFVLASWEPMESLYAGHHGVLCTTLTLNRKPPP